MTIKNYITESQIIFTDYLNSKRDVFTAIAETAIINGLSTSKETIIRRLEEREQMGSTRVLDRFAIPHAQDVTISSAMVIIVVSSHSIAWESLDSTDVRFVFSLLFSSIDRQALQIKFLSEISTLLVDSNFNDRLASAKSPSDIKLLFK